MSSAVVSVSYGVRDIRANGSTSGVATLPPDNTECGTYEPSSPQAVAQGALGWLAVSADDAAGTREADRVPLRTRP